MAGVNKVILVGRLGADPEVRTTPSGQNVSTMSLATSESWTKDGKREERTEWHRVVVWGKQAELAGKFLKKGRNVYIEGKLQTRSWDDPSGQKRYSTEIVANQMVFLDSTNSRTESDDFGGGTSVSDPYGSTPSYNPNASNASADYDDDVPF